MKSNISEKTTNKNDNSAAQNISWKNNLVSQWSVTAVKMEQQQQIVNDEFDKKTPAKNQVKFNYHKLSTKTTLAKFEKNSSKAVSRSVIQTDNNN